MSLADYFTHHSVCDVAGCNERAVNSFSIKDVAITDLKLKSNDLRNVLLCKEHSKSVERPSFFPFYHMMSR